MEKLVILNEQHILLEDQKEVLQKELGSFEIVSVPSEGWSKEEMEVKFQELKEADTVVFASPIPLLLLKLSTIAGEWEGARFTNNLHAPLEGQNETVGLRIGVLHNDKREKKELPNGKIIHTVAKEGWELIFS